MEVLRGTNKREEEISCRSCVVDGIKTGKPVCPDCGTEIAYYCGMYNHEKNRKWREKKDDD